jgi:hypothetical protein
MKKGQGSNFNLLCVPLRRPQSFLCGFISQAVINRRGRAEASTESRRENQQSKRYKLRN